MIEIKVEGGRGDRTPDQCLCPRRRRDTRELARRFRDSVCALKGDSDVARDAFFPVAEDSLDAEDWSRIDDALGNPGGRPAKAPRHPVTTARRPSGPPPPIGGRS